MKTKLFSLLIAVFLFSFNSNAQKNAKTSADFPVITLIGSGNGGWTDTAETPLLTSDGITYTLVDKILTTGEVKFREGKCWETGCAATVGNVNGWGPVKAVAPATQSTGWPSGVNASPAASGPNIQCQAGSWTITFNRVQGSWSFVAGTPIPVIKVVGTAVSAVGGAALTTADGIIFSAKKVTLVPGSCQFSVDGVLAGALTFPNGDALSATDKIPVTTTGIDYDVTFDYTLYKYTFTVATFPKIAIVGGGAGGWPNDPQVDVNAMTTTDGENYTISHIALTTDGIKFRQDNSWNNNWGGSTWPSGVPSGDNIPATVGNYNGTFTKSTGAYTFTLNTVAIVGAAVGGWPNDPQVDANLMSTIDGVNYTLNGLVATTEAAKFRQNNDWGVNSGGDLFPAGPSTGNNIPVVAGTYNLKYNILTGAYDFGTALAVTKFDTANFTAYPNPTHNNWNIVSGNEDITSVQVYNVLGKAVYTKLGSSKEVAINASGLSKGVYFAKVTTAKGVSTVKLVKN